MSLTGSATERAIDESRNSQLQDQSTEQIHKVDVEQGKENEEGYPERSV